MPLPPAEFARLIKSKYPQYQDLDDGELVSRILERHPQYRTQVDVDGTGYAPPSAPPASSTVLEAESDLSPAPTSGMFGMDPRAGEMPESALFRRLTDEGVGALKGIGSSMAGMAKLGGLPFQKLEEAIGFQGPATGAAGMADAIRDSLQPTPTQKAGFGAEQFAEFLAPMGAPVATGSRLANMVRAALESGAITAGQQGEVGPDAGKAAVLGGGLAGVGGAIAEALHRFGPTLKASARHSLEKVLRPSGKREARLAEKALPQFLERGDFLAATQAGLLKKVAAQSKQASKAVSAAEAALPPRTQVEGQNILDELVRRRGKELLPETGGQPVTTPTRRTPETTRTSAVLDEFGRPIKVTEPGRVVPGTTSVSSPVVRNPAVDRALAKRIKQVEALMADSGQTQVSRRAVRALKESLDEEVYGPPRGLLPRGTSVGLGSKKILADAIRHEMNRTRPDIAKLNEWSSNLHNVEEILQNSVARGQTGNRIDRLGAVAAAIGVFAGKPQILLPVGFLHFVASPAYRTLSAAVKRNIANTLVSGGPDAAAELVQRMGVGVQQSRDGSSLPSMGDSSWHRNIRAALEEGNLGKARRLAQAAKSKAGLQIDVDAVRTQMGVRRQ